MLRMTTVWGGGTAEQAAGDGGGRITACSGPSIPCLGDAYGLPAFALKYGCLVVGPLAMAGHEAVDVDFRHAGAFIAGGVCVIRCWRGRCRARGWTWRGASSVIARKKAPDGCPGRGRFGMADAGVEIQ